MKLITIRQKPDILFFVSTLIIFYLWVQRLLRGLVAGRLRCHGRHVRPFGQIGRQEVVRGHAGQGQEVIRGEAVERTVLQL